MLFSNVFFRLFLCIYSCVDLIAAHLQVYTFQYILDNLLAWYVFAKLIPVWIYGFASEPLPIFDKNDDKFLLLLYFWVIIAFAMIPLCCFITGISIDVS